MPGIRVIAALAGAALLGLSLMPADASAAGEGDRKARKLDTFWTHPDIASVGLRSIALLPGVGYDLSLNPERELELAWAAASGSTGYRWYYSTMAKGFLRRAFGGDSVLTALRAGLLKEPRVDSLAAQKLCRALRTSAVLGMRADIWEQTQMEWNKTGKPWTRVALKAALVDSSGRLLWSASGSETGEGPLHNADSGTLGVRSSGLNLQPVTGQGGAPSFQEVLARLFARWIENFPPGPAAAAPPAPAPGGGR